MSEENVENVRKAIEASNRRDVPMARALWHTEAEVDWSRSRGPLKGVCRGREEVETFQDEFWSSKRSNLKPTASCRRAPTSSSRTPPTCVDEMGWK